jgi:hypothetical protein
VSQTGKFHIFLYPWKSYVQQDSTFCAQGRYIVFSPNNWMTFELEQREMSDGKVRQIVRLDNTEVVSHDYAFQDILKDDNIGVHLIGSHYVASGSSASVRNVFKQLCSDPCWKKENCTTFVDNCGSFPSSGPKIATIDVPFNFEISVEIRTENYEESDFNQDLDILHFATADWNAANQGVRLFAIWLDEGKDSFWIRKPGNFF